MPSQMIELENVLFGLLETNCEIINFCPLHAHYSTDQNNSLGRCSLILPDEFI